MDRMLRKTGAVAGGLAALWLIGRKALDHARRFDFRDKGVLITGGSRGLGLVLARQLAAEGARVAICGRDTAALQRAVDDIARFGPAPVAERCDIARPHEVRSMVERVRNRLGAIDVLINNAGIIQVGPLEEMTVDDYEEALATHFWGPLHAIEAVLPEMRRRRSGRIVNITSIGGEIAVPHLVPYCASKFALAGYSRGLRATLVRDHVYVTIVCPGLMRTGSPPQARFKGQHRREYAWFAISDALPLLTISADRAARQIIDACRFGRPELFVSAPARFAIPFSRLCPRLTAEMTALVDRLLPAPGGIGQEQVKGSASQSALAPSVLTALSDRASARNNQLFRR